MPRKYKPTGRPMGRPGKGLTELVQVFMSAQHLAQIDAFAKREGIRRIREGIDPKRQPSRAEATRLLIEAGIAAARSSHG